MSPDMELIVNFTAVVAVALVGGVLAHGLRQSPLVGYLLAGMVVGPFALDFIGHREQIVLLAEVGVIFLMFALGIEFSIKELAHAKGPVILGTLAQMTLMVAVGVGLGMALGWPMPQSIFFGGIICVSSTMVILKNLMHRGEINASHGRVLLGMLIVQDLAVVALVLLLPRLATSTEGSALDLFWVGLKALGFILTTLILGARAVPLMMEQVERLRSPELFLLTAVVLALGMASVSAIIGLSPALGAFMAGLLLTETEFDHRVIAEMVPIRDFFATLFFVSIGLLIDVRFILQNGLAVLGLAAFIMTAKAALTLLALLPFRIGGKTAVFTALGMISIGEFNYVLALLGKTSGALSYELYNLILAASVITIVLTPGAFYVAPRVSLWLSNLPGLRRWLAASTHSYNTPASLRDHAVVAGYGRVGQNIVRGLQAQGIACVVIEQDLNLLRLVAQNGLPAIYGDASYEHVLAAAQPQTARVLVVALPDFGTTRAVVHRLRRLNPGAPIVARAQHAENETPLRLAGASAVVVPEIAGALMLLDETLNALKQPPGRHKLAD